METIFHPVDVKTNKTFLYFSDYKDLNKLKGYTWTLRRKGKNSVEFKKFYFTNWKLHRNCHLSKTTFTSRKTTMLILSISVERHSVFIVHTNENVSTSSLYVCNVN